MSGARTGRRAGVPRVLATGVAASLLMVARVAPARSGDVPPGSGPENAATRWLSLGALGGLTLPDPTLADYQWDVTPRAGWGAEALAGWGGTAAGVRVWTTGTTQAIGAPATIATARVTATSWELVGRATVASVRGVEVCAHVSAGRIHLRYDPERITIASPAGPIEVPLAPVHEWVRGGGLSFQRTWPKGWRTGLELEHRIFGLDTAHRAGTAIVEERSTFGDWSARLTLSRYTFW